MFRHGVSLKGRNFTDTLSIVGNKRYMKEDTMKEPKTDRD